jgi:hypothetical protein
MNYPDEYRIYPFLNPGSTSGFNLGRLLSVFICVESVLIREPLINAGTTRMNTDDINYLFTIVIVLLYPRLSVLDPR